MEAQDQELIKYKNIKHFIYDTDNDRGGMFVSLGIFGSIFNAIFGTLFFIVDSISAANKLIPVIFLLMNISMMIIPYFYYKRHPEDGSYKYSFFLPGVYLGLSGVYSSVAFLYIDYKMLYMAGVPMDFIKIYMKVVISIYFLIVIIQYIWYFVALKKGVYSDRYDEECFIITKRMTIIAKILVYPFAFLYIGIAPFTYAFTRMIVHTVDSYPLQILIFITMLLILPFGSAMSYPVFIWWYLIRKYKKYIPEKV